MAILYGVACSLFSKFFLPVQGILFNTAQQFPTLTPYQSVSELSIRISAGRDFTRGIGVNSVERPDREEDGLMKGQWWQQVTPSLGWGTPGNRQCCQTWADAHRSHCWRLGVTPLQNPLSAAAAAEGYGRHSWLAVAGLWGWTYRRCENSSHQPASARLGKPKVTHSCQKQNCKKRFLFLQLSSLLYHLFLEEPVQRSHLAEKSGKFKCFNPRIWKGRKESESKMGKWRSHAPSPHVFGMMPVLCFLHPWNDDDRLSSNISAT